MGIRVLAGVGFVALIVGAWSLFTWGVEGLADAFVAYSYVVMAWAMGAWGVAEGVRCAVRRRRQRVADTESRGGTSLTSCWTAWLFGGTCLSMGMYLWTSAAAWFWASIVLLTGTFLLLLRHPVIPEARRRWQQLRG